MLMGELRVQQKDSGLASPAGHQILEEQMDVTELPFPRSHTTILRAVYLNGSIPENPTILSYLLTQNFGAPGTDPNDSSAVA